MDSLSKISKTRSTSARSLSLLPYLTSISFTISPFIDHPQIFLLQNKLSKNLLCQMLCVLFLFWASFIYSFTYNSAFSTYNIVHVKCHAIFCLCTCSMFKCWECSVMSYSISTQFSHRICYKFVSFYVLLLGDTWVGLISLFNGGL